MYTFKKEERLCGRKLIEEVYSQGESLKIYPFRLIWHDTVLKTPFPAQLLIVVPKKIYKKATDRNKLKRLIREVYRKNKNILYNALAPEKKQCALILSYYGKEILSYQVIEKKLLLILQALIRNYEKNTG